MYQLDTNINTAVERQADRVRAVQAYGSRQGQENIAPSWTPDGASRPNLVARKAVLVLAAAVPIVLVVAWGLLAR